MKTRSENMKVSVLGLAVQGALVAMIASPMVAQAAGDDVAALTKPTNTIEFGGSNVGQKSAKFGEYEGYNKDGGYFIGNFNVRGGNAYGDGNGTMRMGAYGTDLGLSSRSLGGSVSNQGLWDLSLGYDELRHITSGTYQTPQMGAMGGNQFNLPPNFGNLNGAAPAARSLTSTQLNAFHTEEIGTTRKNTSFSAGYNINSQWSLKFDFNHLDQSGAKLVSTGAQGAVAIGATTFRAEAVNVIMNPTNYKTETLNLSLNWLGDKGHLSAGYYGSYFRDAYNSLSWQNAMTTAGVACVGVQCLQNLSMSTAPDNTLHQLNLSGGYAFTPSTKLVGGLSYGRNTQNDNYAPTLIPQNGIAAVNLMQPGGLPQSSLNGTVQTRHADLKLTNQTTKDLVLSASYKFNERDNRTTSNTYSYYQIGNFGGYTGVSTPYSNNKAQYEVAADYRLTKGQNLRLAYERENIRRWCDSVVSGAQCVASPSSDENKLGLTYRLKASDSVKLNAGYVYGRRSATFDPNFWSNVGSYPAVNAGDVVGFHAAPYVTRRQDMVKGGINWQPSARWDVGLNGRYAVDKYDTQLGVQDGHTRGINLDAAFNYSEAGSVGAYVSLQRRDRTMMNAGNGGVTTAPSQFWNDRLDDDGISVGFNTKYSGLMAGKLDLLGDMSYSFDRSRYTTDITYVSGVGCANATVLTCGNTPDMNTRLFSLKLSGAYHLDKASKIVLAYRYQNLRTQDYYYNIYQYGFTPNRVVPTNEQAPVYSVNMISASYVYNFK